MARWQIVVKKSEATKQTKDQNNNKKQKNKNKKQTNNNKNKKQTKQKTGGGGRGVIKQITNRVGVLYSQCATHILMRL